MELGDARRLPVTYPSSKQEEGWSAMMYSRKKLKGLLSLDDFENAARSYLPQVLFAYLSGGVEDNISLDRNKAAFHELGFVPRIMRDVSSVDIQAELWGETYRSEAHTSEIQSLM